MPFFDEHNQPLDRIFLVQRSPRHFQLLRPISFLAAGRPEQERVTIPAHDVDRPAVGDNQTDLASVPTFLWGLIASYGRQTSAALLHDHLSAQARHGNPATRVRRQRDADRLFGVALIESGIPVLRASIMTSFVSIEKFVEFRRWQAYLMVVHVAVGIAFIYAAVGLVVGLWTPAVIFGPWMLVLFLAPAVSTVFWLRDATAMLVIIHAGVFLAPFVVVAFLAQLVLAIMESTVWLATGRRGPAPVIGPTILAQRRP